MSKGKPSAPDSIDALIDKATARTVMCRVCGHEVAPTVKAILERAKERGVTGSLKPLALYRSLETAFSGLADAFSVDTFRNHLERHEPSWSGYRQRKA